MKNSVGQPGYRIVRKRTKADTSAPFLELPVTKTADGVRVRHYEIYRASKRAKAKQPPAEKPK